MAYIYCITNNVNGKKYVGKTTSSIKRRFKEHLCDCENRKRENRPLYSAMRKYGKENFTIEMLEECERESLSNREIFWIDKLNTYKEGYNATRGGEGSIKIDENEVVRLYEKYKRGSIVAKVLGRDAGQINKILKSCGIKLENHPYDSGVINKKKKIYQYSLDGEFLKCFESVTEAVNYLFEIGLIKNKKSGVRAHICDNANGKNKTAYGFVWKYIKI